MPDLRSATCLLCVCSPTTTTTTSGQAERSLRYTTRVPDFLFTVDPWLPNEAHRDHLRVGRAVAEAAILYRFPRLVSDPEVDANYQPHALSGVAFYFTAEPTTVFDITATRERKHQALRCYRAQFTSEGLDSLSRGLEAREREWARNEPFSHGEALKLLHPGQLHVGLGS